MYVVLRHAVSRRSPASRPRGTGAGSGLREHVHDRTPSTTVPRRTPSKREGFNAWVRAKIRERDTGSGFLQAQPLEAEGVGGTDSPSSDQITALAPKTAPGKVGCDHRMTFCLMNQTPCPS